MHGMKRSIYLDKRDCSWGVTARSGANRGLRRGCPGLPDPTLDARPPRGDACSLPRRPL
jgi:hypothetical protein